MSLVADDATLERQLELVDYAMVKALGGGRGGAGRGEEDGSNDDESDERLGKKDLEDRFLKIEGYLGLR